MLIDMSFGLDRRPYRRRSIRASRESPFTSSVSPMQGQHSSGSLLSLTSETNSSHSTIFNSATIPTPQICKNTLRHTCFEHNVAKVPLSSRETRKLVTWYKRFQGCIVKGMLTKKLHHERDIGAK